MKTASVIARYLAGVIFLIMGLNGFLHFIPFPPPPGIAGKIVLRVAYGVTASPGAYAATSLPICSTTPANS